MNALAALCIFVSQCLTVNGVQKNHVIFVVLSKAIGASRTDIISRNTANDQVCQSEIICFLCVYLL